MIRCGIRCGTHTESRMRENCTYGLMRGRAHPRGVSCSTLHTIVDLEMISEDRLTAAHKEVAVMRKNGILDGKDADRSENLH